MDALNIPPAAADELAAVRRRVAELEAAAAKWSEAEMVLRQGEARFRSLVETTSDWIWEVDADAVYTYVSPKIKELLGYEPREVIGMRPYDLMPPEEVSRITPILASQWAAGQPFSGLENLNRHKDGRLVLFETSGVPLFDAAGQLAGYRGVDRDITERKRAEEARREREEEFRAIIETTNEWIWTINLEGRHTFSNPALQTILGYSPEEFLNRDIGSFLHEEDRPVVRRLLEEKIARKEGWSGQVLRWRHRDGSYRYLESTAVPVRDQRGDMVGFRGSDRDITERKMAEAERDRLFRLSIDMLCVAGFDGQLKQVNPAWEKVLGWSAEELTTRPWLDFMHPDDRERTVTAGAQ
jgi:PAS domain S-box-containing protein